MKKYGFFTAVMAVVFLLVAGCATTDVPGLTSGKTLTVATAGLDSEIAIRLLGAGERTGWWKEMGGKDSPYFGRVKIMKVNPGKSYAFIDYICEMKGGEVSGWSGRVNVQKDGSFSFYPERGRTFYFQLCEDGTLVGNASVPEGQFQVILQ